MKAKLVRAERSISRKALAASCHCPESPLQINDKLSHGCRKYGHCVLLRHVTLEIWVVCQDIAARISALGVFGGGHTTIKFAAEGDDDWRLGPALKADIRLREHAKISDLL